MRQFGPLAGAFAAGAVVVWLASYAWTPPEGAAALETAPPPDPRSAPPGAYDWSARPEPSFPIPPYARFLKGVEIVVDPGHVGQRDRPNWKRGPTGLREAAVNLRVAQYLREFLAAAGATVILTRDEDRSLDLDDQADLNERAAIANDARADLFLSIHHNGVNNPSANYTSVFYHKSPDHSPASLCAARFVLQGVNDALRLESHLACALLSDHLVAKQSGFRVLRLARVPAVLCEASFHSNPEEEARLRDPVYNRREAYGYFLGLARWAQAGLPRVRIKSPASRKAADDRIVLLQLDDGLIGRGGWGAERVRIRAESLVVRIDGKPARFEANWKTGVVRVRAPLRRRPQRLYVDFETVFGQHVLHPWLERAAGGS